MIQIYPIPWCYRHGAFHEDCPKNDPLLAHHRLQLGKQHILGFVSLTAVMFIFMAGLWFLAGGR